MPICVRFDTPCVVSRPQVWHFDIAWPDMEKCLNMQKILKKVVIPVAGLGTRGLPYTKEVPKELTPIIDVPSIHLIVEEAVRSGVEQVILVTCRGKASLEDYFDYSPNLENWLRKRGKNEMADRVHKLAEMVEIIAVRQKEPLGLGHAVMCAKSVVGKDRFGVCLGDEIFPPWDSYNEEKPALYRLAEVAESTKTSVSGVFEVPKSDSPSYGMIDVDGKLEAAPKKIKWIIEKPTPDKAPSCYAMVGRYVFEPAIFDHLARVKPGVGGELQLTDALVTMSQAEGLYALKFLGSRYDIGSQVGYLHAQLQLAKRKPELWERLKPLIDSL